MMGAPGPEFGTGDSKNFNVRDYAATYFGPEDLSLIDHLRKPGSIQNRNGPSFRMRDEFMPALN